jgi:DNA/RNA-binding domain of Phe-tRNA-synthetase-like protein
MTAELIATEGWRAGFPSATAGILVLHDVENPELCPALEDRKRQLEAELRGGAADPDEVLRAYETYYRGHGQTYHVKAQRISVADKGKPIASRAALVEAMFMAELQNFILTAGHDLDALELPIRVDITSGDDRYVSLSGKPLDLKPGDMTMRDGAGIISSVLRGPDQRTPITSRTRNALFAAYAPPGVDPTLVERHLADIRDNVLLISPAARTARLAVVTA